jgi:transcriptional regulator with XRE-family HTH domain
MAKPARPPRPTGWENDAVSDHDGKPATARPGDVPDVAGVMRRMRQQQGMSLAELAEASGLSASFLGAVERRETDIAVQRLARVAAVFGHDVGSLLGYSLRSVAPRIVSADDRFQVDRGDGITYEVMRIREVDFELVITSLAPKTAFQDEITHAGIDICVPVDGAIVIEYDGVDFPIATGQTATWAGSHPHRVRNDGDVTARVVSVTTASMY